MTISLCELRSFALANKMALEEILAEVYSRHCLARSDFALFDGGAHRGYHTIRMANLSGCARVYAVEADPFMADTLRKVLGDRLAHGAYPEIIVIEKALQDDPDLASLSWKSSTSHNARSSIASDKSEQATIWGDTLDIHYREDMKVDATTIDLVLENENDPLPFLKLDLEGADLRALAGAEHTLSRKRPLVAFENAKNAPKVHDFKIEEKAAYFRRLDYVPMNFVGEPIGPHNWFGFFEAWAVPREDAEWLQRTVQIAIRKRMSQNVWPKPVVRKVVRRLRRMVAG